MARGRKTGGGSRKGIPNKSTQDIRNIVRSNVNFSTLTKSLYNRARKGSDAAAKLLLEYGFGRTKEIEPLNATADNTEIAREFSKMVSLSGTGIASQDNNGIQEQDNKIQDSSRRPEKLQDGDSETNTNNGGDEASQQ